MMLRCFSRLGEEFTMQRLKSIEDETSLPRNSARSLDVDPGVIS